MVRYWAGRRPQWALWPPPMVGDPLTWLTKESGGQAIIAWPIRRRQLADVVSLPFERSVVLRPDCGRLPECGGTVLRGTRTEMVAKCAAEMCNVAKPYRVADLGDGQRSPQE